MRKHTFLLLFLLFILSLFIWFFDTLPVVQFSYGITQKIFAPSKILLSKIQKNDPSQETQELRDENQMLVSKLIEQEELKKENNALKSQFRDSPIDSQELLPANIVGFRGSHEKPNEIIIDQGSDAGVRSGMPLIVQDNLIGVVEFVSVQFSSVMLPSHPSFRLLAQNIQGSASGIVSGGEEGVVMSDILITDEINVGDIIVTNGNITNREYGIINNLVIGTVVSVKRQEAEAFQSAELKMKVDVKEISKVFIVFSK